MASRTLAAMLSLMVFGLLIFANVSAQDMNDGEEEEDIPDPEDTDEFNQVIEYIAANGTANETIVERISDCDEGFHHIPGQTFCFSTDLTSDVCSAEGKYWWPKCEVEHIASSNKFSKFVFKNILKENGGCCLQGYSPEEEEMIHAEQDNYLAE